jgi:protein mago nashi
VGGLKRGALIAVYVGPAVAEELKRIVRESEITKCVAARRAALGERRLTDREDDSAWPKKNVVGRQELEVRLDKEHISFEVGTSKRR